MVSEELGKQITEAEELQWSHVFSDMVRTNCMAGRLEVVKLQWSHVFSDMVRK